MRRYLFHGHVFPINFLPRGGGRSLVNSVPMREQKKHYAKGYFFQAGQTDSLMLYLRDTLLTSDIDCSGKGYFLTGNSGKGHILRGHSEKRGG